jgi:hypothetical protein
MNIESILLWGFVATLVHTTIMAAGQGLGLSRMSLPYMIGTAFTPDHRRAILIGSAVHVINGWLFALFYAYIFEHLCLAGTWFGALLGISQGMVVLVTFMPILPSIHPRMADEHRGPEPTRALEPPGFMALNYGRQTPVITLLAHLVYGGVIGAGYRLVCQ